MEVKEITINLDVNGKVQYLNEVLPQIPTNTILYKTLTGLGATYSELKAKRHSIILEPNIPVIVGKCTSPKHTSDNLFGVYEGVTVASIIQYLKNKEDRYYKILTTPESFPKIKEAFWEMGINIYETCFALYDEVHKIIKDIDYREDIVLPIDDFFKFKDKALVSATPIEFSDPRFEEQGFKILKIVPQFDYSTHLYIHPTNNILLTFRDFHWMLPHIQKVDVPYFIFVNSIDVIYSIMNQLDLLDKSSVFCAPKSIDKLKQNGFTNCFATWKNERMKKYNFFTSRFFNALDIELDVEPFIILLTDVYFAEQTMLDPYSDVIQIIGRFRNGYNSVQHISNFKHELPDRTKEDIVEFISSSEIVYDALQRFYDQAPSKGAREAYMAAMDSLPYNKFLTKDRQKNYFTIDNYLNDSLVTGYYRTKDDLLEAYKSNPQTIHTSLFVQYFHEFGDDEQRIKRELKVMSIKEKRKAIVNELELLGNCDTTLDLDYKRDLMKADKFIVNAYDTLSKEIIEEYNYSYTKINEAMILAQYIKGAKGTETIQMIRNSFKVGQKYKLDYIKDEIKRIYRVLNVTPPKAITSKTLNEYFITNNAYIKDSKALLIVSEK